MGAREASILSLNGPSDNPGTIQCDANFLRAVETGATAADLAALDEWQQEEYAARRPTVLAELRAALIRDAQEDRSHTSQGWSRSFRTSSLARRSVPISSSALNGSSRARIACSKPGE